MHTARAPETSASKLVNMVHVDDIITATCQLIDSPRPGERFNAVGCTYTVAELLGHCGMARAATIVDAPPDESSKRIANDKLATILPPDFRFRRVESMASMAPSAAAAAT